MGKLDVKKPSAADKSVSGAKSGQSSVSCTGTSLSVPNFCGKADKPANVNFQLQVNREDQKRVQEALNDISLWAEDLAKKLHLMFIQLKKFLAMLLIQPM